MTTRVICPQCNTLRSLTASGKIRRHACRPSTGDTFALPYATPPLTQNQLRRLHYQREAKLKAQAKTEIRWAIRDARLKPRQVAEVVLHWRMPDHRRRDGDGAAPTLKVCLDALVDEGILPEDSYAHVPFSGIRCHPPLKNLPGSLWLELRAPEPVEEAS